MQIEKNKVVGIHYTISIDNDAIVYSTQGFEPEEYVHGSFSLFPKVAKALEGHIAGDVVEVILPPSEAYGEKSEKWVYTLDNPLFSDIATLETGSFIQIPGGLEARLVQKKDNCVLVDANHPLAGEQLHYRITVVTIRDASETEIKWGRTENQLRDCSGNPGCC